MLINWQELKKYAGFLQDQEADNQFRTARQKAIVKEALIGLDKKSKYKELVVSEKILGSYRDHISLAEQVRGDDSPDRHIKFVETLRNLEKEGFLTIHKLDFDFRAVPELQGPIEPDWSLTGREEEDFYSAEHCHITVELTDSKSMEATLLKQEAEQAIPPSKILAAIEEDEDIREEEEFYEEAVRVIGKLLEVCSLEYLDIELISPSKLAESDRFRVGFNDMKVIDDLKKKNVIDDFYKVSDTDNLYSAHINYSFLLKYAEELHDQFEGKGIIYGFEQQKRNMLKLLQDIFKDSPHEKEFIISESILGTYQKKNPTNNAAGISLIRPDPARPDIRYYFMHVLRALEEDNYFKIKFVEFNFSAQPTLTSAAKKSVIFGSSDEPNEFYPPEHCKVHIVLPQTTAAKNFQEGIAKFVQDNNTNIHITPKKQERITNGNNEPNQSPGLTPIPLLSSQKPSKRNIKERLKYLFEVRSFGKKEKSLLLFLSDLQPHKLSDVKSHIKSKTENACSKIKQSCNTKLEKTEFSIHSQKGGGYKESIYQLQLSPS